jgi:signal transduction histidine kinase
LEEGEEMRDPLFEYYYLIRFEILALILVCGAVAAVFWGLSRRWQRRQKALEQELADCQAEHFQKLYGYFQRIVAHEYGKGLDYILNKSSETLEGLGKEQTALRDKQDGIIAKANDLKQHAMNILSVFALEPDILKKELLNIRQLVESVLLELYPYAESQGVAMRPNLDDIEPIILDRDLTVLAIRNLVHNAIKYSEPGRVVEIRLTVKEDEAQLGKEVVITVKDHGRGIKEADKDTLFELNMRGDGLVETGNGLGLYCARKAASLQGGDVILVSSSPGQGSVFKISFPFVTSGEVVQETEVEPPQRSWVVLRWGVAIAGLLVAAALLYFLFKPPQQVAILSYHDRYVTALGDADGWVLKQEEVLGECGKFILIPQINGKDALLTCHDRFVTAPWRANPSEPGNTHDEQWLLGQEPGLGECEQFDFLPQEDDIVAFGTCAGVVVTAGDGMWPGDMAWTMVTETDKIQDWEKFKLQSQR